MTITPTLIGASLAALSNVRVSKPCLPPLKPGTSQRFCTPRTTNGCSKTSAKQEAEAQIRVHSQSFPKLPDIHTFQTELLQALNSPEIQKAVVRGLIDEIIVHPTAALEVQGSFSNWFSNNSAIVLRRIEPRFEKLQRHLLILDSAVNFYP